MDQICPKRIFPVKNKKGEQHHWILYIRIRFGASFVAGMALLGLWRERELAVYGTPRPRGFNKNTMALLGQSRDSWPSMAPLGHNGLTRMQKILESKNKNQMKNKMKAKTKIHFYFHFCFCFYFCFHFRFCFCFHFHFHFCFCFHFRFCLCVYFRFCLSFIFLVFILKFY